MKILQDPDFLKDHSPPLLALFVVIDMVSIFATSFYSMYVNLLLTVNPDIFNMKLNIFHCHNLNNNTYTLTASL